ncbi:hypothetical protein COLO4_21941 [Corchorus olitorius]|uniref:Uncharacterized protein n=1 Tax=Corchorus olitorius TaxID=93759 RepID=A0A1R3IPV1_9ROSI|nr:hypothetical protein COLO4_21941 [Corchorus olitorius]
MFFFYSLYWGFRRFSFRTFEVRVITYCCVGIAQPLLYRIWVDQNYHISVFLIPLFLQLGSYVHAIFDEIYDYTVDVSEARDERQRRAVEEAVAVAVAAEKAALANERAALATQRNLLDQERGALARERATLLAQQHHYQH